MQKSDLIDFSPVRIFETAANGELKTGEMGLITAKKGLGKTSILVQFGIDSLLKDKGLIHVSFDQRSSNVIAWYDSVLSEVAKKKHIDLEDVADDIVRGRTILNFNQESFTLPKVVNTLKSLKEGGIKIGTIVVDGLFLGDTSKEDLATFASYVSAEKLTAWFSYTNEAAELEAQLPKDKLSLFATVAHVASNGSTLMLNVLKSNGELSEGAVKLDSKTMLMTK
ncbi:MAG: hypothetical protein MJ176_09035 [Treponema sp.]|nr:hypothetical protein [Treponema sp.]